MVKSNWDDAFDCLSRDWFPPMHSRVEVKEVTKPLPKVDKVIFNEPATIIVWKDGSKSVVKCQNGELFDAEKGFALAYLKKLLGNDNTFNKEINKWVKYDEPKIDENKPLTNEELKKMDGKKVWLSRISSGVERFDHEFCGWHVVNAKLEEVRNAGGYDIFKNNNKYPFGFRAYLKPQTGKK